MYWVRSATSNTSTNCSTRGCAATAACTSGATAQRKKSAAGAMVRNTVSCTSRWLTPKCHRSVRHSGRKVDCSRSRAHRSSIGTKMAESRKRSSRNQSRPTWFERATGVATATSEPPIKVARSARPAPVSPRAFRRLNTTLTTPSTKATPRAILIVVRTISIG